MQSDTPANERHLLWPDWVLTSGFTRFDLTVSIAGLGCSQVRSDLAPWLFSTEHDWASAYFKISPEHYLDWKAWGESHCQCRAYTKAGKLCKNGVSDYPCPPGEFNPETTPYCSCHKDPSKRGAPKADGRDLSGYIYLMHAQGTSRYKIGISKQLRQRQQAINRQSPFPVHVVDCYAVNDMRRAESYWHKRFDALRIYGEWFELPPEQVVEFVQVANEVNGGAVA